MNRSRTALALAAALLVSSLAGTALAAPGGTVPGAVYGQQGPGAGKPVEQIQHDLQSAGIKDVAPDNWNAGSITVVVQAGLLKPDDNGDFHPDANVSSTDGVAVFAKVLGIASKNDTPEQAAEKAKQAGIVSGDVSVDRDMSRVEVARMLATALGIEPARVTSAADYPFGDVDNTSIEDLGILKALYDLGIFKGYPEEGGKPTFRPDAVLTRAQIAILVDRILGAASH